MALAILWDPAKPRIECERGSWPVVHPASFIAANEAALLADFEQAEAERTPGRTFRFQLEAAAAAADPIPALNAASFPVLILHGSQDRLVPPENARTLHAALPRTELRWLEGASHNFWQHEPAEAARIVLDFLARAEKGST
jgi:pimeloyl-ACP methyl ester carboxylesterase